MRCTTVITQCHTKILIFYTLNYHNQMFSVSHYQSKNISYVKKKSTLPHDAACIRFASIKIQHYIIINHHMSRNYTMLTNKSNNSLSRHTRPHSKGRKNPNFLIGVQYLQHSFCNAYSRNNIEWTVISNCISCKKRITNGAEGLHNYEHCTVTTQ